MGADTAEGQGPDLREQFNQFLARMQPESDENALKGCTFCNIAKGLDETTALLYEVGCFARSFCAFLRRGRKGIGFWGKWENDSRIKALVSPIIAQTTKSTKFKFLTLYRNRSVYKQEVSRSDCTLNCSSLNAQHSSCNLCKYFF